jgi:hypothetical protein
MPQVNVPTVGLLNIEGAVDRCPLCHHNIQPIETNTSHVGPGDKLERIYRCPRQQCLRLFVARYSGSRNSVGLVTFRLRESVPNNIVKSLHSEIVNRVSPDFVVIFDQAEAAEKQGLTLVCGPGYRKALEFLIKDYLIGVYADKADEIKRLLLGKCVKDYVSDEKVKQVSERAVWLGNDETHYLRKWEGKDLADLKILIQLTQHWIEMDELTREALEDMPEGK